LVGFNLFAAVDSDEIGSHKSKNYESNYDHPNIEFPVISSSRLLW